MIPKPQLNNHNYGAPTYKTNDDGAGLPQAAATAPKKRLGFGLHSNSLGKGIRGQSMN